MMQLQNVSQSTSLEELTFQHCKIYSHKSQHMRHIVLTLTLDTSPLDITADYNVTLNSEYEYLLQYTILNRRYIV